MSTVLHRFTQPTCTLEIKGEKPRSRFLPVQFELRFKDLLESTSEPIIIKGDRQDLEQLREVVDSYLQKSPQALQNIERSDLANRELHFGFLGSNNVDRISLTTVQLSDLVTVLEEYQNATLPKSKPAGKILLLLGAIIVTTIIGIGAQILSRTEPTPNIAPISEEEPTAPITELDEVVPPPITSAAKQPTPQPKLTEPLTSAQKLPPPPAVDTPKPKPDIPDPADYPLPEVARQSQVDIPPTASKETESLAIAPDNEALEIPTRSTTIIDSDEPPASTIQIDPGANSEPDSDRFYSEPPQENEYNPPERIATSTQQSQIQQITTYFQEKWQPPAELKQSLEYRLWLNADGTIERVVPLGKASQLYIDRTNIPLKESFIDPKSQSSIVRLLLNPDGGVQVLSE